MYVRWLMGFYKKTLMNHIEPLPGNFCLQLCSLQPCNEFIHFTAAMHTAADKSVCHIHCTAHMGFTSRPRVAVHTPMGVNFYLGLGLGNLTLTLSETRNKHIRVLLVVVYCRFLLLFLHEFFFQVRWGAESGNTPR